MLEKHSSFIEKDKSPLWVKAWSQKRFDWLVLWEVECRDAPGINLLLISLCLCNAALQWENLQNLDWVHCLQHLPNSHSNKNTQHTSLKPNYFNCICLFGTQMLVFNQVMIKSGGRGVQNTILDFFSKKKKKLLMVYI